MLKWKLLKEFLIRPMVYIKQTVNMLWMLEELEPEELAAGLCEDIL